MSWSYRIVKVTLEQGNNCFALNVGTVTPQPETWVECGVRFTRLESGQLVKDSLSIAPLRYIPARCCL